MYCESRSLAIHCMEVAAGLDKVSRGPSQGENEERKWKLQASNADRQKQQSATSLAACSRKGLIISTPLRNPDVYKPVGKVKLP